LIRLALAAPPLVTYSLSQVFYDPFPLVKLMRIMNGKRTKSGSGLWLIMLWSIAAPCFAEQLPIKSYTTAEGLARDSVNRIVQDSRGFLWFATPEGLSRFDGYRFINYGVEQGLPHRSINDLLETRSGVYWIATGDGLCRFNPHGTSRAYVEDRTRKQPPAQSASANAEPMFVVYRSDGSPRAQSINVLLEDRSGVIWYGTDDGLYQLELVAGAWTPRAVDIGLPKELPDDTHINSLVEDHNGYLWIGTMNGLYRRGQNGTVQRFSTQQGLPANNVRSLLEDRTGQLWAGTSLGLVSLVSEAINSDHGGTIVAREYPIPNINALLQTSNGELLISSNGLCEINPAAAVESGTLHCYAKASGLSDSILALAEDRSGNLWLGTTSEGAMKLARNGFTSYSQADGLGDGRIASIFEDRAGQLCVLAGDSLSPINRFDGKGFSVAGVRQPIGRGHSWGWYQAGFQDSAGDWWIPTADGLYRYASEPGSQTLATRPKAIYTTAHGLTGDHIFRLYEDSRGDIWIGTISPKRDTLNRWDRATNTIHSFSRQVDGVSEAAPTAFREDAKGNIWIGYYNGGLARFRNGRFTRYSGQDDVPAGQVRALTLDHAGRLWIATTLGGLGRIDDPTIEQPHFSVLTTADGLSSNQITSLTEDRLGNLYVGTGRGVDELDPATGHVKHFTTADGLPNDYINVSFTDHLGQLWFGTLHGLGRLIPGNPQAAIAPQIMLGGLRIAGLPYKLSELGETTVPQLELSANQNQLQVDFFSIGFAAGEKLRYQYMLEGADKDWSPPSAERTVSFASLAPGTYRFRVRAVNTDGLNSVLPASVSFRILPPIWRRWWFITLATIFAGGFVLALDRYRVARLREVNTALGESQRAEQAARESEERFRTLAETASDAIITIDEDSVITFANPATEQVFGYSSQELIGAGLPMLMPEYLRHLHEAGFGRYVRTGTKHLSWQAIELPGLHRSGREIPLELSFGEFTKDDRRYFTGIVRDITERKRAEEALRRAREERLAELERVRKRIATDLHDDIGSSLTRISLLSEVAQRQGGDEQSSLARPLSVIAGLSRELVDSMSDIVWAINPRKDSLSDLTQRMRRFASDLFTARGITFRFNVTEGEGNLTIGANFRREIYLIFKEAVNNSVRHSQCSTAEIEFRVAAEGLYLHLRDNGRGFDVLDKAAGHGLASMRERTEGLGGTLEIVSREGEGTTLTIVIPMSHQELVNTT
jgi:PAS domain S-box-containing protein